MIIGDLDLDWAEQDPGYLARVKGFLVSGDKPPAPDRTAGHPNGSPVGVPAELGLK
ncbi:MAG: hypothetical protein VCD66_07350 [Alphaproteobacteria bacterium]|jgi:hypothetical protein